MIFADPRQKLYRKNLEAKTSGKIYPFSVLVGKPFGILYVVYFGNGTLEPLQRISPLSHGTSYCHVECLTYIFTLSC